MQTVSSQLIGHNMARLEEDIFFDIATDTIDVFLVATSDGKLDAFLGIIRSHDRVALGLSL